MARTSATVRTLIRESASVTHRLVAAEEKGSGTVAGLVAAVVVDVAAEVVAVVGAAVAGGVSSSAETAAAGMLIAIHAAIKRIARPARVPAPSSGRQPPPYLATRGLRMSGR
jgi:hypothetical protein